LWVHINSLGHIYIGKYFIIILIFKNIKNKTCKQQNKHVLSAGWRNREINWSEEFDYDIITRVLTILACINVDNINFSKSLGLALTYLSLTIHLLVYCYLNSTKI